MSKKYIFICPKCKEAYAAEGKTLSHWCETCNHKLYATGVAEETWDTMSDEEKSKVKENTSSRNYQTKQMNSSGWASTLIVMGWVGLFIGIIVAFYLGGSTGFIPSVLIGVLTLAGLMTFAYMAEDIRQIRNLLEDIRDRIEK